MTEINYENGKLTAFICGEIDHHSAKKITGEVRNAICAISPKEICLDFKTVSFMDSSGLALIMSAYREAKADGAAIKVSNVREQPYKVMRASGLTRIIDINAIE